jgi:hypothetical protein
MRKLWIILVLLMMVAGAQAQAVLPPLAAITNGDVWLYGLGSGPLQVTQHDPAAYTYFNDLAWSPDGRFLAFFETNVTAEPRLRVVDQTGAEMVTVDQAVYGGFPPTFTPDSTHVIYTTANLEATPAVPAEGPMLAEMEIYSVELVPGATPQLISLFQVETGCGGGVQFPTEARYYEEAGFMGNTMLFALTPAGLVHSTSCIGIGVALMDLETGEDVTIAEGLMRAKLSPDQMLLLGINEGTLMVLDLTTLNTATLTPAGYPDQVAWGAAGSSDVFYSTVADTGTKLALDESASALFIQAMGYSEMPPIPVWHSTIHRINTLSGEDMELYSTDAAWGIGRLFASSDGASLYFSQIPNMDRWVQNLSAQGVDITDFAAVFDALNVDLYQVSLADNSVQLAGEDMSRVTLNPAG